MQKLMNNFMFQQCKTNIFQSLTKAPVYNFGANIKALKNRMKTIGSIRKITKAMKMVAASKMRIDV